MENEIRLSLLEQIGPVLAKSLVSYCGSAEDVFKASTNSLLKIPGITSQKAKLVQTNCDVKRVDEVLKKIEQEQIEVILFNSKDYPIRLNRLKDAPFLLYKKGSMDLNPTRMLAIVGTRRNTNYGQEVTEELVKQLASYHIHILSGLAHGTDILAHKAANNREIKNGAVLAQGLDEIYPYQNKSVAEQLVYNGGALLSEMPVFTKLHPDLFPKRNRIVAGMADALLVIESEEKGGSMVTVERALQYKRPVFAVPGRINDKMSKGCNLLINKQLATSITSIKDIAKLLNWSLKDEQPKAKQISLFSEVDEVYKPIINLLIDKPMCIDDMSILAQMPISKIGALLLDLELQDIIKVLPGSKYSLAL